MKQLDNLRFNSEKNSTLHNNNLEKTSVFKISFHSLHQMNNENYIWLYDIVLAFKNSYPLSLLQVNENMRQVIRDA